MAIKRELTDVSPKSAQESCRTTRLTLTQEEIEESRDLSYPTRIKKTPSSEDSEGITHESHRATASVARRHTGQLDQD
jgi:hypothetical protein